MAELNRTEEQGSDWHWRTVIPTGIAVLLLSGVPGALVLPAACAQDMDPAPSADATRDIPPPVDPPPPPPLESPATPAMKTTPDEEAPIPPKANTSDQLLPVVRIRREEGQMVEEYLNNGVVYMVRIVPENAPPYYMLDTDGDGELDTRQEESDPGIKPVYWKLLEWD